MQTPSGASELLSEFHYQKVVEISKADFERVNSSKSARDACKNIGGVALSKLDKVLDASLNMGSSVGSSTGRIT